MRVLDQGKRVDKNGAGAGITALTTSYTAGAVFQVGAATDIAAYLESTGANATNVTENVWKLQISYDGTNFSDVASTLSSTNVEAIEHTLAVAQNVTTRNALLTKLARLSTAARLMVKATSGGAVVAADTAVAYVVAGE